MRRLFLFIIFLLGEFLEMGCRSNDIKRSCSLCPGAPPVNPNLQFDIVDQNRGTSLFFGSSPKFHFSEISIEHLINGHLDSIKLSNPYLGFTGFTKDTINKDFSLFIYPYHSIDTLLLNIAGSGRDTLLFNTQTENCCGIITLQSVTFHNIMVYPNSNPNHIALLKK